MAIKNYYLILGVSRSESAEGIRAAFRQLAKRYHPDRAGAESTPEFREILEAYEVLSDPERRRQYNSELEAAEQRAQAAAAAPAEQPARSWSRELWTEFAARLAAEAPPAGVVILEAVLHPEQALLGTTLRIELPVRAWCPACGGSGWEWPFPCLACGGQGVRRLRRPLTVQVPPRTRHGTILEIPFSDAAIGRIVLRIRVRVAPF
jgi:DnaJ-class molecular chaperone